MQTSARNQLQGRVTAIHPGAVNADVVLELPGGTTLSAIITNESLDHLGLEIGQPARAVFKAGSVILGVKV